MTTPTVADDAACIIGIGETDYCRAPGSGTSDLGVVLRAAQAAIDDSGYPRREIDGVMTPYINASAEEIMDNLGLREVNFSAQVQMGGASPVASLQHAALAVSNGIARAVIIPFGWNGYSGAIWRDPSTASTNAVTTFRRTVRDYYSQYGTFAPPQVYAQMARRHMEEFGTTVEALAAVAITCRNHAQLNDRALMRKPMTLDDYLASPWVVEPYRRFDCCLETDAGAAVLVATGAVAKRLRHRPVRIVAVAEGRAVPSSDIMNRSSVLDTGLTQAAPKVWERSGFGPADMDFAQIYDCFTFEVIQQIEELGVCPRGEGGHFVQEGRIGLGGVLPINTHGGLLSQAHALGMNHVVEAVRQLRGTAGAAQIDNATRGVVTGWGDMGDGSVAVLERG